MFIKKQHMIKVDTDKTKGKTPLIEPLTEKDAEYLHARLRQEYPACSSVFFKAKPKRVKCGILTVGKDDKL